MITVGVVVPAHNEQVLLGPCLDALEMASEAIRAAGHLVRLYVVCDACVDHTTEVAARYDVTVLSSDAQNVGVARALGAARAIADGAQWLAFTDADSRVASDWLASQLALGTDVVCGTVSVDDWEEYGTTMFEHFLRTYDDRDGHRHIHGANLGIATHAYTAVGGFAALKNEEDVHIVRALTAHGASIAWSAKPRVITSARANYRATAGFGATLARIARCGVERVSPAMPYQTLKS